jgi:thiosulfate dehydrogenase [quinone] large subunit
MQDARFGQALIVYFRLAMGWTFLYAGATQLTEPNFTAATFLAHTKTFHDLFAWFAAPAIVPYTDFLVTWGHTLIGLSLVSGLLVRFGAPFGVLLMMVYYLAHLDFPYVENHFNFIMEYHLVYAGVLVYLVAARAGHVWGLDGWVEQMPFLTRHPSLRPLVG